MALSKWLLLVTMAFRSTSKMSLTRTNERYAYASILQVLASQSTDRTLATPFQNGSVELERELQANVQALIDDIQKMTPNLKAIDK